MLRDLFLVKRSFSIKSISKAISMNFEKCYFRHIVEEDKIDITFLLKVKDNARQFNLSRKPTETLQTLFSRIGTNVQKAIAKGNKKKSPCEQSQIGVQLYNNKNSSLGEQSTCLDLFNAKETIHIKIHDQLYKAIFNSPWVVSLTLPSCILAGFPVYPENFVTQFAIQELCKLKWYRGITVNEKGNIISDMHVKWELVGQDFKYTPQVQDIGWKLKLECTPGNYETTGPAVETVSKNAIEAGPGKCPFETRHAFTINKLMGKRFRCVTYNILADLYCDSDFTRTVLHPYCPPYALHIDYRKLLIMKELIGYNADLICLQEVDMKMYKHYFAPLMCSEHFNGVIYKKGKEVAEGLALFYNKERFQLLGEDNIVLSQALQSKACLQDIWDGVKDNSALKERLLDRSTVASATFLQSIENMNEIIIVGNTHLYFHPDADHIRLIQGGIFIYWLNDIRKTFMDKFPGKRISLIACGDFNSVPSCGIYQLYTTGNASSSLPDWKSNNEQAVENLSLHQDCLLESACGTPSFTNFTAGFADCLDYIFYDKSSLKMDQVIPMPSIEELQAHTALPSIVFPSDHLALVADLEFV